MTASTGSAYLHIALVEHLRHWLGGDGLYHHLIYQDGRIDPAILRQIANSYYVSRGLRQNKEANIAALISERLSDWPTGLEERAAFVSDIASEARSRGLTKGMQLSGFSKLIWFVRPKDWTLYDSFAQRGLARHGRSLEFADFYATLNALGFDETMQAMRGVIAVSHFPFLWPERILDKYLMLCGHTDKKSIIDYRSHDAFIAVHSKVCGVTFEQHIRELTKELGRVLSNASLFQVHLR